MMEGGGGGSALEPSLQFEDMRPLPLRPEVRLPVGEEPASEPEPEPLEDMLSLPILSFALEITRETLDTVRLVLLAFLGLDLPAYCG